MQVFTVCVAHTCSNDLYKQFECISLKNMDNKNVIKQMYGENSGMLSSLLITLLLLCRPFLAAAHLDPDFMGFWWGYLYLLNAKWPPGPPCNWCFAFDHLREIKTALGDIIVITQSCTLPCKQHSEMFVTIWVATL